MSIERASLGRGRRAFDTMHGNAPCSVFKERENSAIVFYDDEPDTIVATGNYPGRFAKELPQ